MAVISRPEPTTLPPTSRPNDAENKTCYYCGSGIDRLDKVCSRCGAPNKNYEQEVGSNNSYGEFIKQVENTEPAKAFVSEDEKKILAWKRYWDFEKMWKADRA